VKPGVWYPALQWWGMVSSDIACRVEAMVKLCEKAQANSRDPRNARLSSRLGIVRAFCSHSGGSIKTKGIVNRSGLREDLIV
jgi:hypothetical protein